MCLKKWCVPPSHKPTNGEHEETWWSWNTVNLAYRMWQDCDRCFALLLVYHGISPFKRAVAIQLTDPVTCAAWNTTFSVCVGWRNGHNFFTILKNMFGWWLRQCMLGNPDDSPLVRAVRSMKHGTCIRHFWSLLCKMLEGFLNISISFYFYNDMSATLERFYIHYTPFSNLIRFASRKIHSYALWELGFAW